MHVYAYMHVYIFNRVIYVKNGRGYHSHTGTMAEVITFHFVDGCSRPENEQGVLHHFEYLFCDEISGTVFLSCPLISWSCLGRKKK